MIIFDSYFTPNRKTKFKWIWNLNVNRRIIQVVRDRNSGEFSSMLGCMHACILSCLWLFLTLWTVACQASLPMGILQAGILEWVATPSSRGFSPPRDWNYISCVGRQILYHWATQEAQCWGRKRLSMTQNPETIKLKLANSYYIKLKKFYNKAPQGKSNTNIWQIRRTCSYICHRQKTNINTLKYWGPKNLILE